MLYQYYASPSYIPPLPLPLPLPLFYLRLLSCIRRSILHGILFLLLGYVILFLLPGYVGEPRRSCGCCGEVNRILMLQANAWCIWLYRLPASLVTDEEEQQ